MGARTDTVGTGLLDVAVEQLPFGVAVLKEQHGEFRYLRANERYEQLAGREGLPGASYRDVRDLNWPDDGRLQAILRTGETWWEHVLPRGGGDPAAGQTKPVLRLLSGFVHDGQEHLLDVLVDSNPPFVETMVEALFQSVELRRPPGSEAMNASLIARVATLASSSLTLRSICERTLAGMREQLEDLVAGGVYVLESEGARIRALAEFCDGHEVDTQGEPLAVTAVTDVGRLILNGYQLVTHEHGTGDGDAGVHMMPSGCDSVSITRCIDLAIERRGTLLGVLELGFVGGGSFKHDEIRLYQGIAAILGNAIGNARSYEAEALNARIAGGVGRILGASIRAHDEEQLGRECLEVIEAVTESEFGFIAARTPDGRLEGVAVTGGGRDTCVMPPYARERAHESQEPKRLYRLVLAAGETLIANPPSAQLVLADLPEGHPPLGSFMGTPLAGKTGEVFGVIGLANRPGGYSANERDAVEALAPAVVESFERFRAERQLAESARFADELSHIESIIHASLDFDTIAEEALRTGRQALGADSAAMALYEPPNFRLTHSSGFRQEVSGHLFPESRERHGLLAIRTKTAVLVEDSETDVRVDTAHLLSYGIRAVMVIPLLVGGTTFGNVYYNFAQPKRFSEAEVRFALRLSLSLSLAMENARLYEAERTISNRLQEALLSLPDSVPGVSFAHAYYPTTVGAKVGGDFYDIFELSYGLVGIAVGDVAGKGVDAAALTSLVKNTIRAHASERGKTPAQILRLTNEVLYKTTPVELFVTVFFGILDSRDGRFVYANGGHPTAAIVRPGGEVARLAVTGPLLGALPDVEIEHGETDLSPEDTMFLYTDGLTEARSNGELYGEERLFTLLAESTDHRPRQLMHRIVAEVMAFSHGQLRDDLALLVVRRSLETARRPQQVKFEV